MIGRYLGSIALAGVVTFGLFFLMQYLVAHGENPLKKVTSLGSVDFVRLKKEELRPEVKKRLPPKVKVDKPPPPPQVDQTSIAKPGSDTINVDFDADVSIDTGNIDIGAAPNDGDVLPLVRVPPQYPRRAEASGIEGWVDIEFTISKTGTVMDPVVIDNYPSSIFNRAAIRAIRKWKYKPKIEDGAPVERYGIQVRITFALADDD